MGQPLDSTMIERLFVQAGFAVAQANANPFVLVTRDAMQVVWANGPAVTTAGTSDADEVARRLFRPGSPSAQAMATRISRLRPGTPPHLERLIVALGFKIGPITIACHAVDGPEPLVLIRILEAAATSGGSTFASALDGTPELDGPPASTPPPQQTDEEPPLPSAVDVVSADLAGRFGERPARRALWESDAQGRLMRIDPIFETIVGASAPRAGDDLVSWVIGLDPEAGARLRAGLQGQESLSGLRVAWPIRGTGTRVAVDLGCLPRSGQSSGTRGFAIIQTHLITEGADDPIPPVSDDAIDSPLQEVAVGPDAVMPLEVAADTVVGSDRAADDHRSSDIDAVSNIETADPIVTEATLGVVALPPGFERLSKVVHLRDFKSGAQGAQPKPTSRPPVARGADQATLTPPQWSESPDRDDADTQTAGRLTHSERFAFDEIARALGARTGETDETSEQIADLEAVDGASASLATEPMPPDRTADWPGVFDRLPLGLIVIDDSRILYANPAVLDRLGYADVDRLAAAGGLDIAATTAGTAEYAQRLTRADGTQVETLTTVGETLNWEDAPATLISLRWPAEGDAKTSAEAAPAPDELAEALELAADGIGFVDALGTILSFNAGAERLFGYRSAELQGKSAAMLFLSDQETQWSSLVSAVGARNGEIAPIAIMGRTRVGSLVPLRVGLAPSGKRFCMLLTDESDRKRAEDEIEAARREAERSSVRKSEFLAKVSHEIRTPLNAILGFTEIMMDERLGPLGNRRYKEYLDDIHASGTQVMSLINDLLDLSRIEAGRLDLKFEPIDANAVVSECVVTLQAQANRERVIVRQSLAPGLPPANADGGTVRQIVLNLLSNAVKFNEPGGQVIVSTALTDGNGLAIRIRDTGHGMSDDEIETAMEPFKQLATARTTAGSGLGLPLTRALVEASQARMTIKSRPKEGTLVEVVFHTTDIPPVRLPAE